MTNAEIANRPSAEVSTNVKKPRGFIEDDQDLVVLPVAKLLQRGSPEVEENVEGAKPGILWDTIEGKPLGAEFVPVRFYQEAVLWRDREQGGGIMRRTTDLTDPSVQAMLQWGASGEPPAMKRHLNCVVLVKGRKDPVILSWSGTSFKAGRAFYNAAKARKLDLWATVWKWESKKIENQKGSWFILEASPAGNAPQEVMDIAEGLFDITESLEATYTDADAGGDEQDAQAAAQVTTPFGDEDTPDFLK